MFYRLMLKIGILSTELCLAGKIYKEDFTKLIMFNWLFGSKKEIDKIKEDTREAFEAVKTDMEKAGQWFKHLSKTDSEQEDKINELKSKIATLEKEFGKLHEKILLMNLGKSEQVFRQASTAVHRQQAVQAVQKGVEKAVQKGVEGDFLIDLNSLSVMERAIVYLLLNSDMKLSYEDIAMMLGKNRSTIRSQISTIKQKSGGLIKEYIEKNGKKRVYIPDETKEKVLKDKKVREVKRKGKKNSEKEEASYA